MMSINKVWLLSNISSGIVSLSLVPVETQVPDRP
jgi:hypothetical protein